MILDIDHVQLKSKLDANFLGSKVKYIFRNPTEDQMHKVTSQTYLLLQGAIEYWWNLQQF